MKLPKDTIVETSETGAVLVYSPVSNEEAARNQTNANILMEAMELLTIEELRSTMSNKEIITLANSRRGVS